MSRKKIRQGDAFYLAVELHDQNGKDLIKSGIERIIFTIGNDDLSNTIVKEYPGDVEYENDKFKIWIDQEDTLPLEPDDALKMEARIKFNNGQILGTDLGKFRVKDSLNEEEM